MITTEEIENYKTILVGENDGKEKQLLEQRKRLTGAIYEYLNAGTEPDSDHIVEVTAGMHRDVQLRDFVLGLSTEVPMVKVNLYLSFFMETVPDEFIAPIASILAANLYSMEDETAQEVLHQALECDPQYSLAKLLSRVFGSNWPASAFNDMTRELHPKVKAGMGI